MKRRWAAAGTSLYLALCLLPVLGSMPGGNPALLALNARRGELLWNTVLLGVITAALCSIIGLLAAAGIFQSRFRHSPLRWSFLLLAPVPAYVYALSWMQLIRLAGKLWPPLLRTQISGLLPCVLVETLCFLPFCTALALAGLERQDGRLVEAGLLCKSGDSVFWSVILPSITPMVLAGAGCVFVLSATDFSIPSLFQFNVYAMEPFSEFSALGNSGNSFYLALPLVLLSILAIVLIQPGLAQGKTPMRVPSPEPLRLSSGFKLLSNIALGICVLQICLPVLSLLLTMGAPIQMLRSLELAWAELLTSFQMGLLSAVITLPLSCGAAAVLVRGKKGRPVLGTLLFFPLALPGALVGIGWLELLNGSPFHALTQTVFLPALGCASRFAPLAMLVMAGVLSRMDHRRIEAARLLQSRPGSGFLRVIVPMVAPGMLAAALTVFLLTIGEVGAVLVLTPPGGSPISIKIYNYLHYGASEQVSGFCLVQTVFCAAAMAVIMKLIAERRERYAGSTKTDKTV